MIEIAFGVGMFTVIILALVVVLMGAKKQLVSDADIKIIINDDEKTRCDNHSCRLSLSIFNA